MDYSLYRLLFRKILATNLVDHHCIPSINQQNYDFINSPEFELTIPCPSNVGYTCGQYSVLVSGLEPKDMSQVLLKEKQAWNKKLAKFKTFDQVDALRSLKRLRKGEDSRISLGLRQFVEHINSDPIPNFEGDRNWLYSGTTVTTMLDASDDSRTLVYAAGPGLSSIGTASLTCDGMKDDSKSDEWVTMLKMHQPILQLAVDTQNDMLCSRQKRNLTILKKDGPNFKVMLKKKVRKSRYFTSVAMKNGMVALAKNVGSVALFDIQVNKLSYLHNIPREHLQNCTVRNSWSQLHWRDEGLLIVKSKMLNLADPRGGSLDWDLHETLEDCEDVCNYFDSPGDGSSGYVATNHNLFHVDLLQKKILHKWTHLMKNPPSFGQTLKRKEDELIMLQSPYPGEAVVVGRGGHLGQVPVKLVSGVTDALNDAQLHGVCLDPDVSKRAHYTVTGTHLFPCQNITKQVTQNAGGDVFVRDIVTSEEIVEDEERRRGSWRDLEENAPIHLKPHQSDIVDMTKAFDALQIPYREKPARLQEADWALGEQVLLNKLPLYKDTLVHPILEIWNLPVAEDEEEMDEGFDDLVPSELKVEQWLQRHAPKD